MSAPDPDRRAQVAAGLAAVRERIAAACRDADRSPDAVTLVAVTKTWPASDAALAYALGVRDLGENKDQEAAAKAAALAQDGEHPGLRWHFVGQLQTNKARSVAAYADVVHALDRERLARALSAGAQRAERSLDVLVQVSLDDLAGGSSGGSGRGGVDPAAALELAHLAAGLPGLRLAGVMGVAPREGEPRAAFERLRAVHAGVLAQHPGAGVMSAGMSGDLEAAVAAGATHLRVGTAVFGHRSPVLR